MQKLTWALLAVFLSSCSTQGIQTNASSGGVYNVNALTRAVLGQCALGYEEMFTAEARVHLMKILDGEGSFEGEAGKELQGALLASGVITPENLSTFYPEFTKCGNDVRNAALS